MVKLRFFSFSGIKSYYSGEKVFGIKNTLFGRKKFSGEKSFLENKYIFREKRVNAREQKGFP